MGRHCAAEIWKRELGLLQPRSFAYRVGASETFVRHLDLYGKLHGHKGCVNTVHFSPSGDILVSGSDDEDIIFWNWATKKKILTYFSGHHENVFQAQIMPYSDDRIVVTSAADGQVRLGRVMEDGEVSTRQLGTHQGRVHKLAIEPGSPHIFYSCGEDGFVQHFDLRNQAPIKLLKCLSFSEKKLHIQLNTIAIDPRNPNIFSTGGCDEYARVYDIRNYHRDSSRHSDQPMSTFCPCHLIGSASVHITGLDYSNTSELLVSYNDELIYLFQKGMGVRTHPKAIIQAEAASNHDQQQVFAGHRNSQTVKGVTFFGPHDEYVACGSDCGYIYIWQKKNGKLVRMMDGDKRIVNSVEPHPFLPFLATCGLDKTVKVWTPKAKRTTPLPKYAKEIMKRNKQGRDIRARIALSPEVVMHVLTLQRRQVFAYREPNPAEAEPDSDSTPEAGSPPNPEGCKTS